MRNCLRTGLLTGLAVTILAACADPQAFLPKPYRPANKGQNRVAQMILPDHIVVPLVRGLDEKAATLLTRAVIDDFVQRETIATSTSPTQRTSRLYGEYFQRSDGAPFIRWTFHDPYGDTLDDFEVPAQGFVDTNPDTAEARMLAKSLARTTTARVLSLRRTEPDPRMVISQAPRNAPLAPRQFHQQQNHGSETIIVTAIFDAPAEGRRQLRDGITRALGEAGLKVTRRPDKDTFRLQCTVGVTESRPGFERLALTWELKSPAGDVLATIDQANEVPAGSLEKDWAELAPLVTQGAATGISNYFANEAARGQN